MAKNLRADSAILEEAGDLTADYTSPVLDIGEFLGYALQCIYSGGTPVGTIQVQGSNDGVNWVDIPNSSATSFAVSSHMFNLFGACWDKARVKFTAGGGSAGSLKIVAQCKG